MIPILQWELRRRRGFVLWWSIGIVALIALTLLTYGTVREQSAELSKAFGDLGNNIGAFIGTTDMFSPAGYLNSQLYFITLPILFIILSTVLASSLLGRDETNHTLELLLARPVSRSNLLGAKALAGLLILTIVGVIAALATVLCAAVVDMGIPTGSLLLATASMTYFSGAFGAVAFMCFAASTITRRFATLAAIVFSFGSYIITSLSGLVDWLRPIAKALPYHYYDPNALLAGNLPLGFELYTIAMYVIVAVVAVIGFRRRDIV